MKKNLVQWTVVYSLLVLFTSIQAQTSIESNKIHSEYLKWIHEKELSAISVGMEPKNIPIPAIVKAGKDILNERSVSVSDSLALVALYNHTNGPNWVNHTNWLTGPVETWFGILVSEGRVVYIDLHYNNLSGTIPTEIGNLSNLWGLALYTNQLTGTIPSELGNLTILQNLYLSANQLTGNIPPGLCNLVELRYLNLSNNKLSGSIPTQIGNLVHLIELGLNGNYLTGNIPVTIGALSNLYWIDLGENQITGPIPHEIGNLTNLQFLFLFTNQLDGSIPIEIGNLPNLQYLYLQANQLTGNIPTTIGNLSELKYLGLGENNLTGNIPTEIGKLSKNLEGFYIGYNQLSGTVPDEIFKLLKISILDLSGNQFSGSLSPDIGNMTNLISIYLNSNHFSGNLPATIGSLSNLQFMVLQYNEFTGNIPVEIKSLSNLSYLNIANCRFENLPALNTLTSLTYTDISSNKFTFEDIEPSIDIPGTFYYSPQDSIGEKKNLTLSEGDNYTMSVSTGGAYNVYQWLKNGYPLNGENSTILQIVNASPELSGVYTCQVTNSIAPQLILSSRPVTITIQHIDHFKPVWSGNGLDHMNFYALSAKIDGMDMQPGDEIGIFDGNVCVGAGTLTQVLDGTNFFEVRVSKDEPSTPEKDGYTPGNSASFKLWDNSERREITSNSLNYISGSNIFQAGASTWYQIGGSSMIDQAVSLQNGWNIFSLYVTPNNTLLMDIVKPLIDEGSLVKIQNEAGAAIELIPVLDIWIDNIGNWNKTEGYKIRVNKVTSFTATGIPLRAPVAIDLQAGWNIMGYPAGASQNAMNALHGLIISNNLMKVQDETGAAIEPLPLNLGWIDNIGDFDPGEGYKIRVLFNDVLTITPPASGSLKAALNTSGKPVHFKNKWEGNGYDHMNIYLTITKENANDLKAGDEIGIFDGLTCVGSAIISDPSEKIQSLVVSEDDPFSEDIDGFTKGNSMSFKIWRASDNTEIAITSVDYLTGYTNLFEPLGTTVASVRIESSNHDGLVTSLGDNYPNPFAGETTIPFTLGEKTEVDLAIYNLMGQRVKTLVHSTLEKGSYDANWKGENDNQERMMPGIYLYRMMAGNTILVKNIELSK